MKPFREWYKDNHGQSYPGAVGGETYDNLILRALDAMADYADYCQSTFNSKERSE